MTDTFKWSIVTTMAYIVPRKNGAWEIRETRSTPDGPRSRTLATFRALGDEVIAQAQERAEKPIDPDELRQAALRAGAPLEQPRADRAASQLLEQLSMGREPRRALRRLLADAVKGQDGGLSDAAQAAQEWVAATPEERGKTLVELLRLGDALPKRRRPDRSEFPGFGRA